MKKFTAKEQHSLCIRGFSKDPNFTEEELKEHHEIIKNNPDIKKTIGEVFGLILIVASETKIINDRADKILALVENGGMSDFINLPPVDGRTLLSIITKVTEETINAARSIQAKENSKKRHTETNKARDFVRAEWEKHRQEYENNKSEFARSYVAIIANRFTNKKNDPLHVTEKTIRESWLSDTPAASKQAGQLASG